MMNKYAIYYNHEVVDYINAENFSDARAIAKNNIEVLQVVKFVEVTEDDSWDI